MRADSSVPPVLHVPSFYHEPRTCFDCGLCCRVVRVPLTSEEVVRHREYAGTLISASDSTRVGIGTDPTLGGAGGGVLNPMGGGCCFLEPGNRCAVHRLHGNAAKPVACRLYPLGAMVPTPEGIFGSVSLVCPEMADGLMNTKSVDLVRLDWPTSLRCADRVSILAGGDWSWSRFFEFRSGMAGRIAHAAPLNGERWIDIGDWNRGCGSEEDKKGRPTFRLGTNGGLTDREKCDLVRYFWGLFYASTYPGLLTELGLPGATAVRQQVEFQPQSAIDALRDLCGGEGDERLPLSVFSRFASYKLMDAHLLSRFGCYLAPLTFMMHIVMTATYLALREGNSGHSDSDLARRVLMWTDYCYGHRDPRTLLQEDFLSILGNSTLIPALLAS